MVSPGSFCCSGLAVLLSICSLCSAQCAGCEIEDTSAFCWSLNLNAVPSCLQENTTLLDVSFNNFTVLTGTTFATVPKVRKLFLDYNAVSSITSDAFGVMRELESLSLFGNALLALPDNIFDNNPGIEYLDISQNQIYMLSTELFRPLISLTSLMIYGNPLSFLSGTDSFAFSQSLVTADLGSNALTTLNPDLFAETLNLQIFLDGNPWNCDCVITTLQQNLQNRNASIMIDPTCTTPNELVGTPWSQLNDLCS